jgi:hypothetical protein
MGGSWSGDVNDCWDYCFGKEASVVNQLSTIVNSQNFDGVDIDYEYFYEDSPANRPSWNKGTEAINFLRQVTTGLRAALPAGSIVTHAPMDSDLQQGGGYYNVLKQVSSSLDFLMPQYYNGITRPAIDGISNSGAGQVSALSNYNMLVNDLFGGEEGASQKVVFGFCINDCSHTGSNVNAQQAASIMSELKNTYPCNGGAFFWVALHDTLGSWSSAVSAVIQGSGCNGHAPDAPTVTGPTVSPSPSPSSSCTGAPCSISGHCRSKWGHCGSSIEYCNSGSTWKAGGCESDAVLPLP